MTTHFSRCNKAKLPAAGREQEGALCSRRQWHRAGLLPDSHSSECSFLLVAGWFVAVQAATCADCSAASPVRVGLKPHAD